MENYTYHITILVSFNKVLSYNNKYGTSYIVG